MLQQHSQQEEASVDVSALVKRLNSKVPNERQDAERALNVMGPDAVVSLLDLMRRENRAYVQRQWMYYALTLAPGFVGLF